MEDDRGHAVVIGGSIAGLCAARVLADSFRKVTVLERDPLPQGPDVRRGTPQGHHIHALLAHGSSLLDGMFPGLDAELAEAGAPQLEVGRDVGYLGLYGWACPFQPTILIRSASRPLLEQRVRRRVLALDRVAVRGERQVTELIAAPGGGRVTGVVHTAAGGGGEERLEADLVVDASGRGSRAPAWLQKLGRSAPGDEVVDAFMGYATRIYEDVPPIQDGWRSVFVLGSPSVTRGGVVFPIEGGRAYVTLAGMGRDYPPTDEAGFHAYAGTLRAPHVLQVISRARPVSDIHGSRSTANRWVHYERLKDQPEGFVALGDAVCAFNPVYGQGMTVAAKAALLLGEQLKRSIPARRFPRVFQRALAARLGPIWSMATTEDFRLPTTSGKAPLAARFAHAYFNAVLKLSVNDPDVTRTVSRVLQLLDPPGLLLRPGMVVRALARSLRG